MTGWSSSSAAFGALLVMTVLSAVLGHAVPTLLPQWLTSFLAAALFLVFGVRLLREGLAMSGDEGVQDEMHEVERELAEKEKEQDRRRGSSVVSPYVLEMGPKRAAGSRGPRAASPRRPGRRPCRPAGAPRHGLPGCPARCRGWETCCRCSSAPSGCRRLS